MRIESSIITSLSELRAIEQQRIADERAAIERTRAADIEARRAAEQAKLDAQERRVREEREAQVRIEIARAEAERDARVRVEAAEAAERNRLAAQLEERRLVEEMELRRAEVAKKRPTWMIGVTIIAALAAIGLTWFAIQRSQQMAAADEARERAIREKEAATVNLREAQQRLAALQADVDRIDADISRLTKQLTEAQNADDRKKAAVALAAADQAKRDAKRRIAEEEARKEWIKRHEKVDVSKCTGTALGCMKM
jgi:colicin import membrane protein